jgi:hypothetical protein
MAAGVQRDTSELGGGGAGSEFTGHGLSISLMNQHPEYDIQLIFLFKIVFTAPPTAHAAYPPAYSVATLPATRPVTCLETL